MMTTLIIAQLTINETRRRHIMWVALIMGLLFLAVFGLGFSDIQADMDQLNYDPARQQMLASLMLMAGLYANNFLIVMMAVLTSVTAISSEIDNYTVETLLTKPVRRWEIVLGKWMGFSLMLMIYTVIMTTATMLIVYRQSGHVAENILAGIGLIMLEGLVVLSLTIAGGTRLSSLANGVLAFMLYGVAFVGGWVEQIGSLLRNETAVDIGIASSLLMPSEVLWKKAILLLQPESGSSNFAATPFMVSSQPSNLMVLYAAGYVALLLLLALWSFSRRDL